MHLGYKLIFIIEFQVIKIDKEIANHVSKQTNNVFVVVVVVVIVS